MYIQMYMAELADMQNTRRAVVDRVGNCIQQQQCARAVNANEAQFDTSKSPACVQEYPEAGACELTWAQG